jgi:hypothetical protein
VNSGVLSLRTVVAGLSSVFLASVNVALAPSSAQAQEPEEAFETLDLGVHIVRNVSRSAVHEFWDTGTGLETSVSTTFYAGAIQFGARYAPHAGRRLEYPDFSAWYLYGGWSYDVSLPHGFTWQSGFRIGLFIMNFDSDVPNNKESELGTTLQTGLAYSVTPKWSLDVSGRYQLVFTHERLRYGLFALGVRRSFTTPHWLRWFFE